MRLLRNHPVRPRSDGMIIVRCESLCRYPRAQTRRGEFLNRRGCARHERPPEIGDQCLSPRRSGPIPRTVDALVSGEPLRGSGTSRRETGGVARPSLHPRLFTGNPAGVHPRDASDRRINLRLRRPRWTSAFLGKKPVPTVRTARTSAMIAAPQCECAAVKWPCVSSWRSAVVATDGARSVSGSPACVRK